MSVANAKASRIDVKTSKLKFKVPTKNAKT